MANDEFSRIRQWTARSAGQQGDGLVVGIGDDAAVFAVPSGFETVVCCDAMIETVHFRRDTMQPEDIGYKAMVSNISDIAAMGGRPRYALVTIAVPNEWTAEECERIYAGMYEACDRYNVRIIGGDTVSAPDALHLSVTLIGEVPTGRAVTRSAARPGDAVFVTGALGGSAAGLHVLDQAKREGVSFSTHPEWKQLVCLHQRPEAQVRAGQLLAETSGMGALNDVSDGLASELWEIAEASRVSLYVHAQRVPLDENMIRFAKSVGRDPLEWALFGGEDYQLVGTVASAQVEQLAKRFAEAELAFFLIGEVRDGPPDVYMVTETGTHRLSKGGYQHF